MRFALGGGCVCVSLLIAIAARRQLGEVQRMIRRLPPWQRTAMACLLAVCLAYGGTKTNQVDGAGLGLRSRSSVEDNILCTTTTSDYDYHPPTVTPEDIARGWQVWEVRTNAAVDYAMPEGAVLASNWWMRGAYEDVVRIGNGDRGTGIRDWLFPFGTNEYSSLWAFSWGKARFALASTNAEIVAVGAPMSAVPYHSRLWSAADANGSRLVTWENFALNRDTNTPVNAQIEFRASGDFVTRSNEVETVCRRVDPEDWDGDGIPNDRDCRPYACDGDFFGPRQSLPEGANADAYCWIEVAADANARVVFTGDGCSDLPDPDFMVRAGETNRVRLLIGKTYAVQATQPLTVTGRTSGDIRVSGNGSRSLTVVWPVTFAVAEGRAPGGRPRLGATLNDGGKSFYVMPNPSWLRGRVVWSDGICCGVRGDGTNFAYACGTTCPCTGCTVRGNYLYEGYGLPVMGVSCGCRYVPDSGPASVSIAFDRSAVIYEDDYTNLPGVVVHPARSNAVLRCTVTGGTYGGTLSVALGAAARRKLGKISGDALPSGVRVEPGTSRSYETVYSVLEPSGGVGDIAASAIFHEDFLNSVYSNDTAMTAVKVELEAVYDAPENHNPSRHVYGVGEKIRFKVTPQSPEIKLKTMKLDIDDYNGAYELFDGIVDEANASATREYVCPISANYHPPIRVKLDQVEYWPCIELVEPQIIVTPEASWAFCHGMGEVGQSKLVTENFIGPMNVSFQGVMIAEIPCTEEIAPIGYFATTNFTGYRSHTMGSVGLGAGAGYARRVQGQNRWTTDEAGGGLYQNWSPGKLEWKIPIGWSRVGRDEHEFGTVERVARERASDQSSRPLLIGGRTDKYKQIMTIDDEGTSKIEKFGHWLSRGRYCRIILDGETKQWFHPLW